MNAKQTNLSMFGTSISGVLPHTEGVIGATTFPRRSEIKTTNSSRYDENEKDFLFQILMRDVFGAYHEACMFRKRESGLSRSELGERVGKDKTGLSKLLRAPSNWTLKTLSDFANALDTDVKVVLHDRKNLARTFDRTGLHVDAVRLQSNTNHNDVIQQKNYGQSHFLVIQNGIPSQSRKEAPYAGLSTYPSTVGNPIISR